MPLSSPRHDLPTAPGRRWLITGTSRGLGAALAGIVERDLGGLVLGIDRSPPAPGAMHAHLRADLATREGQHAAAAALRDWRPHVLVNNAAINHSRPLDDTTDEVLDAIVGVAVAAPFVLMRELVLSRTHGEPAWAVNILSPYRAVGVRSQSLYCATKAAVSRMGESLAVETRSDPAFRVISVVPGVFNSEFRPLQPHDAWLVRWYRSRQHRSIESVAQSLVGRLSRPSARKHRTLRISWDGAAIEWFLRTVQGDLSLLPVDRLIGQRRPREDAPPTREPA